MGRRVATPTTLADAIRKERGERGWSQSRLARELETTETSVQNWESGKDPSHKMYAKLCLLFAWPLPYSGDSSTAREISFPDWGRTHSPDDLVPAFAAR